MKTIRQPISHRDHLLYREGRNEAFDAAIEVLKGMITQSHDFGNVAYEIRKITCEEVIKAIENLKRKGKVKP